MIEPDPKSEVAAYEACQNAIEPADAETPKTHEGKQARKMAYREGRLISQRAADNRAEKAAIIKRLADEHAANEAKAAAVIVDALQDVAQDVPAATEAEPVVSDAEPAAAPEPESEPAGDLLD